MAIVTAVAAGKGFIVVIVDTLGAALAGSSAPGCAAGTICLSGWGGMSQSTLGIFGTRPLRLWHSPTA
jgi:hypothetical protein